MTSKSINVLHVDDEPSFLHLMSASLKNKNPNIIITSISTPLTALKTIKENPKHFDIVILDFQMPEMDGIQLAKEIKAIDKSVVLIILTGKSREEVVIKALNSGIDFYLQKNLKFMELVEELSHLILTFWEKRRNETELFQQNRINQILLDKIPHPVMLIKFSTKEIIAANKFAKDLGAIPGKNCHSTLFGNLDICTWCCAEDVKENNEIAKIISNKNDIYRCYWNLVEDDLYIHTIIALTLQKEELRGILDGQKISS